MVNSGGDVTGVDISLVGFTSGARWAPVIIVR
jgi:hypothetical protein